MDWSGSPTATSSRPPPHEPPQQPDLGRVGVLVLVDEDRVVALAQAPLDLGALGEQHGAVHQLGVVEDAAQVEDVEVVGEEVRGGGPVGAPHTLGEAGQLGLAQPELAAAGEDGADLVGEAAGGQAGAQVERPGDPGAAAPGVLGAAGEQLADHDVLLGAGEQPQRLGVVGRVLVGAEQGVAEGVEGGGLRGGGAGTGGTGGEAVAIRSRSSTAALRLKVRTRIRSGSVPFSIRRATASTSVVVLPVPGPASTSSGPPVCSTTARW